MKRFPTYSIRKYISFSQELLIWDSFEFLKTRFRKTKSKLNVIIQEKNVGNDNIRWNIHLLQIWHCQHPHLKVKLSIERIFFNNLYMIWNNYRRRFEHEISHTYMVNPVRKWLIKKHNISSIWFEMLCHQLDWIPKDLCSSV